MDNNDYCKSKSFLQHRDRINGILEGIPFAQSPRGWILKGSFSIGGFRYFGFSESSDILFVSSSNGRGLIDMFKNEKVARDYSNDYVIDEILLTTEGFDILEGHIIRLCGRNDECNGSSLPTKNKSEESLFRVSPFYPLEDIIFQPPFENCLIETHNKNCVRVYRGYLYCYGFSFSGKYFVIANDGGVTFWESDYIV